MGLLIKSRKYSNRFQPEEVNFLLGNTGDWLKLKLECEFVVLIKFTLQAPLILDYGNLVIGDGTYWNDYGFMEGDSIYLIYTILTLNANGDIIDTDNTSEFLTIDIIQGDIAILQTGFNYPDSNVFPYVSGFKKVVDVKVYSDKKPEGLDISYNHLANSYADATLLQSVIDGSITKVFGEGLNTLGLTWHDMEFSTSQSGMSVNSARWRFISSSVFYHTYEIEIVFMISSFYEYLSNFEDNIKPSYLIGEESLTDNFLIVAQPQLNNPNVRIQNDMTDTKKLGSVGWFDENFNGKENDFTIDSLIYEDVLTGDLVDTLSFSDEVKVTAVISGIENLTAASKVSIGFVWLPEDESFFKNKENQFHKNLLINTAGDFVGGVFNPDGVVDQTIYQGFTNDSAIRMDVRQVTMTEMGGNLVYEAIWSPTDGFKNFINDLDESERSYGIWISAADRTLSTTLSNRVNLLLDFDILTKSIPVVGEWEGLTINYYEHNNDGSEDESCNLNMIIEDDILVKVQYPINVLEPIPNAIEYAVEIENTITGERVTLESYNISLAGLPTIDDIPQVSFEESRGFHYVNGNNKNWVKINSIDGSPNYIGYYGLKIRWEDWIQKDDIPNDFYNALLLNDGYNNNWINYLQHSDWKVVFSTYLEVNDDELGNVRYRNTRDLEFANYDENENIEELEWTFKIESTGDELVLGVDDETGKPLGVILSNEKVRVEVVFERNDGNWSSVNDIYGLICIETYRGSGSLGFRQLSSIIDSEPDNPLRPIIEGERLKVELLTSSRVRLSCLVDPDLLQEVEKYKLSARINCNQA